MMKISRGQRAHLLARMTSIAKGQYIDRFFRETPSVPRAHEASPRIRIVHQSGDVSTWHPLQADGSYEVKP